MKLNYEEKMCLAYLLRFTEIREFLKFYNNKNMQAKHSKHINIGKNIKRRNTKKEQTHGKYKSICKIFNDALMMKDCGNFDFDIINDEIVRVKTNEFILNSKEELRNDRASR